MADKPILFSSPMVRAILEGHKTQTRRILSPQPERAQSGGSVEYWLHPKFPGGYPADVLKAKAGRLGVVQYAPGDLLWVRESWKPHSSFDHLPPRDMPDVKVFYLADPGYSPSGSRGRPGIHMPRKYSRLTLIVETVKVERLQEISTMDAMAEGIPQTWGDFGGNPPQCFVDEISRYGDASGTHIYDNHTSIKNFSILWNSINGPGSWEANPWVAAIGFRAIRANIDNLPPATESASKGADCPRKGE